VTGAAVPLTRDVAVAVFVVDHGRVLLRWHPRLQRWLPPGGHVEPNEIPDDAAIREVLEETGVHIRLIGDPAITINSTGQPRQLCRPLGIQLADISPGHQHIDLVYLATGEPAGTIEGVAWFTASELGTLDLGAEVAAWCEVALQTPGRRAERETMLRQRAYPSPGR
jgi:8-oxo-dGTP pyrophosphatase MutT (NUDIX family)